MSNNQPSRTKLIPIALAWIQLITSVAVMVVLMLGYFSFSTQSGNGQNQMVVSASESLSHAKKSIDQTTKTLGTIKTQIPTYVSSLQNTQLILDQAALISYGMAKNLNFQAPTSIEMQGIKPIIVMSRPLATNASNIQAMGDQITAVSTGLKNAQSTVADLPILLEEVQQTLNSTQGVIEGLEPIINRLELAVNWGTAIAFMFAIWCFLNSLTTLTLTRALTTNQFHAE